MLKIRRSHDRLIFNMEIHIPGKDGLYIGTGPWWLAMLPQHESCETTNKGFTTEPWAYMLTVLLWIPCFVVVVLLLSINRFDIFTCIYCLNWMTFTGASMWFANGSEVTLNDKGKTNRFPNTTPHRKVDTTYRLGQKFLDILFWRPNECVIWFGILS